MSDGHGMQSLGEALGIGTGAKARRPIIAPSEAVKLAERAKRDGLAALKLPPTLSDLIDTRPTEAIADHIALTDAAMAELRKSPIRNREAIARQARVLALLESEMDRAKERDELQSFRPEGCWCLGNGGRTPYYRPMATGERITDSHGGSVPVTQEVELLKEHCSCEEGKARALKDATQLRAYDGQVARQLTVRRFGEARLPLEYLGYPWREIKDAGAVARVDRWLASDKTQRDAHHWLLVYGPGGRGKTTVLHGLAADLTEAGESVLFRTVPDLLADIRAAFGDSEKLEGLRTVLKTVRHLFLDDIGAEVPRDWVAEFFFDVLNHRHDYHLPTYMSTNLWEDEGKGGRGLAPFAEHMGTRIWGRIKRMAEPVRMNGVDMRELPHVTTS